MSDLDPKQRMERARRANEALNEFVNPALDELDTAYLARMKELVSREPWNTGPITALVMAMRLLDVIRDHIAGQIHDGDVAARELARVEKIASIPEAKRRILGL